MIYIIIGFVIAVVLEYFLAKQKKSWLGIILPVACLITTIISVILAPRDQTVNVFQQMAQMGFALLYFNIPTIILIMIYLRFHKESKE